MAAHHPQRSIWPIFFGAALIFCVFLVFAWLVAHRIGATRGTATFEKTRGEARLEKLQAVREAEAGIAAAPAWANEEKGLARLPIEAAMTVVVGELKNKKPTASSVSALPPAAVPDKEAPPPGEPTTSPAPAESAPAASAAPSATPEPTATATPAPTPAPSPAAPPMPAATPEEVPLNELPAASGTPAASPAPGTAPDPGAAAGGAPAARNSHFHPTLHLKVRLGVFGEPPKTAPEPGALPGAAV